MPEGLVVFGVADPAHVGLGVDVGGLRPAGAALRIVDGGTGIADVEVDPVQRGGDDLRERRLGIGSGDLERHVGEIGEIGEIGGRADRDVDPGDLPRLEGTDLHHVAVREGDARLRSGDPHLRRGKIHRAVVGELDAHRGRLSRVQLPVRVALVGRDQRQAAQLQHAPRDGQRAVVTVEIELEGFVDARVELDRTSYETAEQVASPQRVGP